MEGSPPPAAAPRSSYAIEDPKRLDVLIGHYDKTSELVQTARTQRDRHFLLLLGLMVIELFSAVHPRATQALTLLLIEWLTRGDRAFLSARVDLGVVNLFAYSVWLYLLLHYYQRASYVRIYLRYLARLEDRLGALLGPGLLTREGAFYRANRGRIHASARFFYDWLFHGLLFTVLVAKGWSERPHQASQLSLLMYGAQGLLSLSIAYYAVQYMRDLVSPKELSGSL